MALRLDYGELEDELRTSFEVALHAGTAAALVLLAGTELATDAARLWRSRWSVVVLALLPPALVGLALGHRIERDLGGPRAIALALAAGSLGMLAGEARADDRAGRPFAAASAEDGLAVGLAQAAALLPGISRSGATIAAARWRGFAREDAHRLSWAVALPVMAGAALLQGLRLRRRGVPPALRAPMAAGAGAAFGSTLAAGVLLRPRLRRAPVGPFALYRTLLACWVMVRAGGRR